MPEPNSMSKPTQQAEASTEDVEKTVNEVSSATQSDVAENTTSQLTQATGTGSQKETGGNPALNQSYLQKLLAKIAKVKRYPRSARKEGVTGTATVNFIIHKNGRVSDSTIVASSGDARLDQEVLDMLERASPFPHIPSGMGEESLNLTLPIEFSLTKTRKLF
jgi:protein TonB